MKTKIFLLLGILLLIACQNDVQTLAQKSEPSLFSDIIAKPKLSEIENENIRKMLENAVEQTNLTKNYDPAYVVLPYPNGDVPIETGVCTDVVVRAMRKGGIDLQKDVHEDMLANFSLYPKRWGLTKPDANIDHRRVPNLQMFFTRKGKSLPITENSEDYKPGDIVAWNLDGKSMTHVGVVSNLWNEKTKRYLVIHNIGNGAQAEDVVFNWKIIGHYRYF